MRCIKPNDGQRPSDFQAPLTLHQLRCCGVLEVTRIARAGYPTRYLHRQFAERYHALLHGGQSGAPAACISPCMAPASQQGGTWGIASACCYRPVTGCCPYRVFSVFPVGLRIGRLPFHAA